MENPTQDPDGGIEQRSEDYLEAEEFSDFEDYNQLNAEEGENQWKPTPQNS